CPRRIRRVVGSIACRSTSFTRFVPTLLPHAVRTSRHTLVSAWLERQDMSPLVATVRPYPWSRLGGGLWLIKRCREVPAGHSKLAGHTGSQGSVPLQDAQLVVPRCGNWACMRTKDHADPG